MACQILNNENFIVHQTYEDNAHGSFSFLWSWRWEWSGQTCISRISLFIYSPMANGRQTLGCRREIAKEGNLCLHIKLFGSNIFARRIADLIR